MEFINLLFHYFKISIANNITKNSQEPHFFETCSSVNSCYLYCPSQATNHLNVGTTFKFKKKKGEMEMVPSTNLVKLFYLYFCTRVLAQVSTSKNVIALLSFSFLSESEKG